MKKKNTLIKTMLLTLSILGLAAGFEQSTLHAKAAHGTNHAFDCADPDTEPDDVMI